MELKRYLRIVIGNWWIVLPTFLTTVGVVLVLTITQTPTYQSVAKYVVKTSLTGPTALSQPDPRSVSAALDVLSRDQVKSTVAEVAMSKVIRDQVANELGLGSNQLRGISVNSRLLPGTNVVEITVGAANPALARDFAAAVGTYTATYFRKLYGTYEMEMLDEPRLPASPAKPNTSLNLLLGALAALVLGAGLAFLSEYLRTPAERTEPEMEAASDRLPEPVVGSSAAKSTRAEAAAKVGRDRTDGAGETVRALGS